MMRKKYYYLFIIIIAFHLIFCPFLWIEAKEYKEQPDVCSGPSKTMALYFQFQNDMMSAMLWSSIEEKRFYTMKTDWGLFKEKILTLGEDGINAIDMLATTVWWNMQSAWSRITTLTVLLQLAALSVWQSNTEWLRILTKDRVIVREYKRLLDIESSIMELAYYLSKYVNLTSSFEWNLIENVNSVIKRYQELWLLEKTDNSNRLNWASISDIMSEMIVMNAYMKHFILFNKWLDDFEPSLIPGFDYSGAIEPLENDYSWLWAFWACNQYAFNLKSTWNKWVKNSQKSLEDSLYDVKQAWKRLGAMFGIWNWKNSSQDSNRCDMSEYEMAQLRAYRWWNRSCKTWLVNGNVVSSIQEFIRKKQAQQSEKEKTTQLTKEERNQIKKAEKEAKKEAKKQAKEERKKAKEECYKETWNLRCKLSAKYAWMTDLVSLQKTINNEKNISTKSEVWSELFWTGVRFNVSYSEWLESDLLEIYSGLMVNYEQSHGNAISSDLSYELVNIKALLDQVEDTSVKMDKLKETLNDIAKYQCKNGGSFY